MISVAVAESGRRGEVRFVGEIPNRPESVAKLIDRLGAKRGKLAFCNEAGPCGYALHRQIAMLRHDCVVVAPSLVPTRPGDRVKTDRRDAVTMAALFRSGELTPVWVPDDAHEAMRDLCRARQAAMTTLRRARQQTRKLSSAARPRVIPSLPGDRRRPLDGQASSVAFGATLRPSGAPNRFRRTRAGRR